MTTLDVRRLQHRETKRERKENVQAYLVQPIEGDAAEVNTETAYVEWRGVGTSHPTLACLCCHTEHPAEPACQHIEEMRAHLGYKARS